MADDRNETDQISNALCFLQLFSLSSVKIMFTTFNRWCCSPHIYYIYIKYIYIYVLYTYPLSINQPQIHKDPTIVQVSSQSKICSCVTHKSVKMLAAQDNAHHIFYIIYHTPLAAHLLDLLSTLLRELRVYSVTLKPIVSVFYLYLYFTLY